MEGQAPFARLAYSFPSIIELSLSSNRLVFTKCWKALYELRGEIVCAEEFCVASPYLQRRKKPGKEVVAREA